MLTRIYALPRHSLQTRLLHAFSITFLTYGAHAATPTVNAETVFNLTSETRAKHQLPSFYSQGVDAGGILILASEQPRPEALIEAKSIICSMLSSNAHLREALSQANIRVTVIAVNEFTTDVPEHSHLTPKHYWDRRARGLGGTVDIPVVSCGEENLLGYQGDPYDGENILVHEFSHAVHLVGMAKLDPDFDSRLRQAYELAMQNELWKGTYAAENYEEYFAEGSQSWFGCNAPPGPVHGEIRTRAELRRYDPRLATLLEEVYGDNDWEYVAPRDRRGADNPLDRSLYRGKRFVWPEHLNQVNKAPGDE